MVKKNPLGISVCLYDEHEKFEVLRAAGYDFNRGNEYGYTPAWAASYGGHVSILRKLVELGCNAVGSDVRRDPDAHDPTTTCATGNWFSRRPDANGFNLNFVAVMNSAPVEMLQLQFEAGCDVYNGIVNSAAEFEITVLDLACKDTDVMDCEDRTKMQAFFDAGFDINSYGKLPSIYKRLRINLFCMIGCVCTRSPDFVHMILDKADLSHKVRFFGSVVDYLIQCNRSFEDNYVDWMSLRIADDMTAANNPTLLTRPVSEKVPLNSV
jgi:hypothetical protein